MDASRFDAWTRRRFGFVFGGGAASLLGLSVLGDSEAKKKRKRKKRKKKKKDKCKGKCGGSCPRCSAGSSCEDRDECTTAFCDGGVCTEPADAAQCGLDTDGVNGCFRRENLENGEFYCSRQTCRFIGEGSCNQCTGQEICSPAGGDNIECCMPCGSPL